MIGYDYKPADEADPLRPTKYRPEYCQMIIDFFSVDSYKTHVDEERNDTGLPAKFPTVERFADSIGVVTNTVYNWSKKHPEFLHSLKRAINLQKTVLIEGSMAGLYQSPFNIFAAKNLIGWTDHGSSEKIPQLSRCKTSVAKLNRIYKSYYEGDINMHELSNLTEFIKTTVSVQESTDFQDRLDYLEKLADESRSDKTV